MIRPDFLRLLPPLPLELHRRPVRWHDRFICPCCRCSTAYFDDVPHLVDPGFVQMNEFRRIMTDEDLRDYPFTVGSADGKCRIHECPPERLRSGPGFVGEG